MSRRNKYNLLTFYKFVDISNARELVADHKQFCNDIGLRGRIFIGEEGINATLTGNIGQTKAYRLYLDSIPEFRDIPDIDEKTTLVDSHKFPKMIVRYRKEILALGEVFRASEIDKAAHRVSADEFKNIMDTKLDDYVILDMRNDYEYDLGHFKTAIPAGTVYFRELKNVLEDYKKQFDGKKIIMYCTGGIRCEKAGALLQREGIEGVYQLDGGVVKYVNKYNDGNWLGNLYTFDDRISTPVGDDDTHTIISKCHYTGEPAEEYFNCRYPECNDQIISTENEYKKHFGFCSEECVHLAKENLLVRNEKFDQLNYKSLRGIAKTQPSKREDIAKIIANNIDKNLQGIVFNIKNSAKLSRLKN